MASDDGAGLAPVVAPSVVNVAVDGYNAPSHRARIGTWRRCRRDMEHLASNGPAARFDVDPAVRFRRRGPQPGSVRRGRPGG